MTSDSWYLDSHAWRKHLLDDILAHWRTHAIDQEHGGYVSEFDRLWQRNGPGTKTLVSQTRLIFNFCIGYRHTADPKFREAADHGMSFLKDKFADTEHGGWFWQCAQDGTVQEDHKVAYGHAFAIFALSEYARTFGDSSAAQLAGATVDVIGTRLADADNGGYWTQASREWQPATDRRSQNPHMHLLEALLSLHIVAGDAGVLDAARAICQLAADRYIHPQHGCLEEFFAADWSRLDAADAAPIEVGHQFEWFWLLSRMADRTGEDCYRRTADGLLQWALQAVAGQRGGGVAGRADRDGRIVDTARTFWPQSEALRALLYESVVRTHAHAEVLSDCAAFIRQCCIDHDHGGWYSSVDGGGKPINSNKGGVWKLDYHAVSLCDEALRLLSLDSLA